jgi:TolB-like protein
MSANKNDEYLSDGMTEELINALAKVPGLRVPGRTSCFAFKGKTEADIFRKVGDQLHVNTVLEGSVRKAGEKAAHYGSTHQREPTVTISGRKITTAT